MKQPKTILFFPIEIGLAHITRSLAVAEELHRRGYRVLFALAKKKQKLFPNTKVCWVSLPPYSVHNDIPLLVRSFQNPQFLLPYIKHEIQLLKKFHPDLVVIDYQLTAVVACAKLNIPTVFLTNSEGILTSSFRFPNTVTVPLLYPLIAAIGQIGIAFMEKPYFRAFGECARKLDIQQKNLQLFERMHFIVPEIREYLHVQQKNLSLSYVGNIVWNGFDTALPPWLKNMEPDGKTIYITFGGTGFAADKLVDLSVGLVKQGYRVIVSSGAIADPQDFPKLPNLYVSRYIAGTVAAEKADAVVCHGGYGTLMQAVAARKPVVVIPFNPDQLLHGLRFQELGLGLCCLKLGISFVRALVPVNWEKIYMLGKSIPLATISADIRRILKHRKKYETKLQQFCQKVPSDGAYKAADVIKELLDKE